MGRARRAFFQPRVFFELIFTEPTLIAWYVAGWFVVLQQWEQLLLWLPAAFLWRLIWDVLMVKAPVGAPDSRGGRCFVKSAWAAASGVFYACISICVLAALMILLCVIGFLAAGSGSNRQRRRRD